MNIVNEFEWRGMIHEASEGLKEVLVEEKITAYIGFDPSAASLHIGSLLPIMGLAQLQRYGHTPIAVIGGGTGMIGDPSGKTLERQLLSKDQIEYNLAGIKNQLSHFLDFEAKSNPALIVNNADWLLPLGLVDFLRDIGKYFTVNYMMAKESVKRRLEQETGISFTEFSYMLLQSYDFLMLHDLYHCRLQMGGSDQWGNIVAGTELIRRLRGNKAYALVFPLVTTSTGIKFGKTVDGAIWLDPELTSPFQFYQFWFNTDDKDAATYLKYFTFLDQQEIGELETLLAVAPEKREAQKRLAKEVTLLVHGEAALQRALQASQVLFGGEMAGLSAKDVLDIFGRVPSSSIERRFLEDGGGSIVDLVVACKLAFSRSEARRLIEGGGIYLNNQRFANVHAKISSDAFIEGKFLVLRKGAKDYHLLQLE